MFAEASVFKRIDDPNIRTTLEVQEGGRTRFVLSPAAVLFVSEPSC